MPVITLPDGSQRTFDQPVTVAQVAAGIGTGLAKAALAGKVSGKLVDTSFTIAQDAALEIVTDKHPDALEVIRHSTAHLLAQATQSLFPEAQVTIGPVIEDGFYYDFSYKRPFTPEDLAAIEAKMAELSKADLPVQRREMPRDEAVAFFKGRPIVEIEGQDFARAYFGIWLSKYSINQKLRKSLLGERGAR